MLQYRLAQSEDAALVQEISAAAYIPAYTQVIGAVPKPAHEDYLPRIEQEQVWLLQEGPHARGVIVLETASDSLLVYSVAVRPEDQGKGHGRRLLDFAVRRATETGAKSVSLYTNAKMTSNLALYESAGFVEVGRRPHPSRHGETLVDLVRRL